MCGRFTQRNPEVTWRMIHAGLRDFLQVRRYNIAPSQEVAILRGVDGAPEPELSRWGLRPHWLKDPSKAQINARSETAAEKPFFRDAFKRSRCAVPADGWYEWQAVAGGRKQPYFFRLADERPFLIAGLRTLWSDEDGDHSTFALLTTAPNPTAATVHDRMPVLLGPEQLELWLDPTAGRDAVQALCAPYAGDDLVVAPVAPRMNNARVDDASCVEPIALATVAKEPDRP